MRNSMQPQEIEAKEVYTFEDLVQITRALRSENGCPWDKEQTHLSLTPCMIEEAYEVVEAINNEDIPNLCEELGDVLLQVTMHTEIAEEVGDFCLNDVTTGICKKLIRRHPHVFGDLLVSGTKEVLANWEEIKKNEKNEATPLEGIKRIPKALPACIRGQKTIKKSKKADYISFKEEEIKENVKGLLEKDLTKDEIGELLFEILKLSEEKKVNAEEALRDYSTRFVEELEEKVEEI